MIQQQVYVLNNLRMFFDALVIVIAGYSACYIDFYQHGGQVPMDTSVFVASVLVIMFINNYVGGNLGLYSDRKPLGKLQTFWSVTKAIVIDFAILSAGIFVFSETNFSKVFYIYFSLLSLFFIVTGRLLLDGYICSKSSSNKGSIATRKILLVGSKERGRLVAEIFQKQLSWGHKLIGRLATEEKYRADPDCLGVLDELPEILKSRTVDEVIFCLSNKQTVDLSRHLAYCNKVGVPSSILPSLWDKTRKNFGIEIIQGVPFITSKTDNFNATGLLYKRILDIVGGISGLLILLCCYPFVFCAIKLESPGPVFFKQKRVGMNGRIFELYKFRSMYEDAEERKKELMSQNEMNGLMFKMNNDPRITKVGAFLRKTSLDEFPQFINVLKGEMSLVGTRPPTLEEVEQYEEGHFKRISAKPGITGLWQVSGRNEIKDFDRVVELDCQYFDQWHFADDLKILAKTILVVLRRKGAV